MPAITMVIVAIIIISIVLVIVDIVLLSGIMVASIIIAIQIILPSTTTHASGVNAIGASHLIFLITPITMVILMIPLLSTAVAIVLVIRIEPMAMLDRINGRD